MPRSFPGRRKRLALIFATGLVAIGVSAGTASAATTTFSNPASIAILDDTHAAPYPSTLNVAGLAGNVQKVTATLHGFTHTYADDVAVLLVGPTGARTTLMGNVGGDSGSDTSVVDLTFDQSSGNTLNDTDTATTGTYRPSEAGATSLSPPAPASPYPLDLNTFIGAPANGVWQLFIEDQASSDSGAVLGGWSLNITAPVNTVTARKPKLNKKKGTARIPVTIGDAGILTLKGKGVKAAKKATAGPGTVKLNVKPKGKTASKLNSTGSAAAKVKITFTPNGGTPNVVKKKVKLKKLG